MEQMFLQNPRSRP